MFNNGFQRPRGRYNDGDGRYNDDETEREREQEWDSPCPPYGEEAQRGRGAPYVQRPSQAMEQQPQTTILPVGLSVAEATEPGEPPWKIIGRVLLRVLFKTACEVGFMFFDRYSLKRPMKK
jgi:hypothetical protein